MRNDVAAHVALVALNVETDLFGVVFKDRAHVELFFPVVLVFVKHIVHFPEFALYPSRFSRHRRLGCMFVDLEREFVENDTHFPVIFLL